MKLLATDGKFRRYRADEGAQYQPPREKQAPDEGSGKASPKPCCCTAEPSRPPKGKEVVSEHAEQAEEGE